MDELDPDEVGTPPNRGTPQEKDADLISGLEHLLAEEGTDLEEEELSPNDFLSNDQNSLKHPQTVRPNNDTSGSKGRRRRQTRKRQERKHRDQIDFKNLHSQIQATPTGIQISDDHLLATINRITSEISFEEISLMLNKNKIKFGIDYEMIRSALAKTRLGQIQYEVVVARGKSPSVVIGAKPIFNLPKELTKQFKTHELTSFELLKKILDGPKFDALKLWKGPVKVVQKGDVISEMGCPTLQPGMDIYGQEIRFLTTKTNKLKSGQNTSLSQDGTRCLSEIYGFAGLVEGKPVVLPPIWISDDQLEAWYVYLPSKYPIPRPTEKELKELLKSRDYTKAHDYKFLVDENKKLHSELDNLKHDKEKRMIKTREAGL